MAARAANVKVDPASVWQGLRGDMQELVTLGASPVSPSSVSLLHINVQPGGTIQEDVASPAHARTDKVAPLPVSSADANAPIPVDRSVEAGRLEEFPYHHRAPHDAGTSGASVSGVGSGEVKVFPLLTVDRTFQKSTSRSSSGQRVAPLSLEQDATMVGPANMAIAKECGIKKEPGSVIATDLSSFAAASSAQGQSSASSSSVSGSRFVAGYRQGYTANHGNAHAGIKARNTSAFGSVTDAGGDGMGSSSRAAGTSVFNQSGMSRPPPKRRGPR